MAQTYEEWLEEERQNRTRRELLGTQQYPNQAYPSPMGFGTPTLNSYSPVPYPGDEPAFNPMRNRGFTSEPMLAWESANDGKPSSVTPITLPGSGTNYIDEGLMPIPIPPGESMQLPSNDPSYSLLGLLGIGDAHATSVGFGGQKKAYGTPGDTTYRQGWIKGGGSSGLGADPTNEEIAAAQQDQNARDMENAVGNYNFRSGWPGQGVTPVTEEGSWYDPIVDAIFGKEAEGAEFGVRPISGGAIVTLGSDTPPPTTGSISWPTNRFDPRFDEVDAIEMAQNAAAKRAAEQLQAQIAERQRVEAEQARVAARAAQSQRAKEQAVVTRNQPDRGLQQAQAQVAEAQRVADIVTRASTVPIDRGLKKTSAPKKAPKITRPVLTPDRKPHVPNIVWVGGLNGGPVDLNNPSMGNIAGPDRWGGGPGDFRGGLASGEGAYGMNPNY